MKRYIFTSILFVFSLLALQSQVSAFSVSTDAALPELQCTEFRDGNRVYESKYIYIHNNGMYTNENGTYAGISPKDVFLNYGNEFVIRSLASSINVANNLPTKINVPHTQADWSMPTNYIPSADSEYVVMGAKTPISINRSMLAPNDAVNPAFQIAYTLTRVGVNNGSSRSLGPIVWQYVPFGASVATKPWGDIPRALKVNNTDITKVECFNYYARWCGDGILDTTKGEVCDDGAQNGQAGKCNTTCTGPTVILPACVPGTTTGPQTAPLTAASPGLCPANQTVGGFTGTTVGTLTTYNWSCNGSAVGGACAATFNSSTVAAGVDLSIKKYASGSDAQDNATSVVVNSGSGFNYTISVANVGTGVLPASLTTVADTLPAGVTLSASPTGTGWTCITVGAGVGFSCSRNDTLAANGALFPVITIPVTATGAPAFLVNTGTVTNPNDIILTNNADPAVIALNGGLPLGPRCNTISASLASPVAPGASVTYTCTATGYTIPAANLEYRVDCGATTGTWGSSNTGTCLAPAASNATANVSCAVRDKNLPTVIFTGSSVGSCLTTVTTTGPGEPPPPNGGASHVSCINGIGSCAMYDSIIACEAVAGVGNCDSADASGQARCAAKASAWKCGPGGPSGSCGDGVLQPDIGEECDIVGGADWCKACKVVGLTTPGANPITDIWMTIPLLDRTKRLGYSKWLDGQSGKIAFQDNRMVLGQGTKAFTLADTVGFGIKTEYRIPLIIPVDKKLCLQSDGSSLTSNTLCTTFGEIATLNGEKPWTQGGTTYMNIGQGYYQELNTVLQPRRPNDLPKNPTQQQREIYDQQMQAHNDWRQYRVAYSNASPTLKAFKGSRNYENLSGGSTRLNDAFIGNNPGESKIKLIACSGTDCSNTSITELISLDVRVSSAIVSSIGASTNRSLELFLNKTSPFVAFLGANMSIKTDTSTTNNNVTNIVNPVKLPTTGIKKTGVVNRVEDLEKDYALNGNKNIFAIDGDLTISCPTGKTFEMTGVRTVIVNHGNLIIKCNITYADAAASWAWIANGGDIRIDNGDDTGYKGITNLAGVYVATTGKFAPIEGRVTQAVLKVEGSMYGNANELFDSRLYARATGAYDILTTGTVLTYSNRALVSPPPLLSQYLGNYSVQRVIQ